MLAAARELLHVVMLVMRTVAADMRRSKSVDMLVRRGWLERWIDKRDRRQTMVRLTPQGGKVQSVWTRAQPPARSGHHAG